MSFYSNVCIDLCTHNTLTSTYNIRNFTFCCLLFDWTALFGLRFSFMCDIYYTNIQIRVCVCALFFLLLLIRLALSLSLTRSVVFSYIGFARLWWMNRMHTTIQTVVSVSAFHFYVIFFLCVLFFFLFKDIWTLWIVSCVFAVDVVAAAMQPSRLHIKIQRMLSSIKSKPLVYVVATHTTLCI